MTKRGESTLLDDPEQSAAVLGDEQLRTVLSHLSHELSRPLLAFRAGLQLLQSGSTGPVSSEQSRHLDTMVVLCDDLLRLTRSYLDYAALVNGAKTLHYGSFTLKALVGEIDHQFAPIAAARRLAWKCMLEGPDATVVTDASRCQQIFGNLVANAVKYTPAGGEVQVTARHETTRWTLTVTDSGPGIPSESLSRVFEPFYRLKRDEQSAEGTGLGLAICRELVNQLGGEIELGSEVGRGTGVLVRLPNGKRPGPKPARSRSAAR